jgi:hypothetical protein
MLELAQELEEVFPTYDISGNRITPVMSHHRMLACATSFTGPDCDGSCDCSGVEKAKCKARQLKCKAVNIEGLSFPICESLHLFDLVCIDWYSKHNASLSQCQIQQVL